MVTAKTKIQSIIHYSLFAIHGLVILLLMFPNSDFIYQLISSSQYFREEKIHFLP
uniref:Uncharacterized protein n=1 Tax=Rhizophora mucronata TaxID=61149 RepID=A0A2P2J406_RHIMU